jgi:pimeloyl-ACP methyl ester carboxylesterase
MSGEQDELVPTADVRAAAALMRQARFVSVPGVGHWLPRDAPAQVVDELRQVVGGPHNAGTDGRNE